LASGGGPGTDRVGLRLNESPYELLQAGGLLACARNCPDKGSPYACLALSCRS
jgi:hypothetical protein